MRYSSAVVLSTIAVGQAAAAHLHNRHASFHARRQADAKRSPGNDVNWDALAYDLTDVDWNKVNYGSPVNSPTPTPAAQQEAPKATQTPVQKKPEPSVAAAKVEVASSTAEAAPKPSATKEATFKTESVKDVTDAGKDLLDTATGFVTDFLHGVESRVKSMGISKVGVNSDKPNGGIWIGDDSNWKAEFTNDATDDAVLFCWVSDKAFENMSLNRARPEISVGLKSGQKVALSFAEGVSMACAPAFDGDVLGQSGIVQQTWWEATFVQQYGTFDVSYNTNMKGRKIVSKGSQCSAFRAPSKEEEGNCAYVCDNEDALTCEKGYSPLPCGSETGGGAGYDPIMDGLGGGCSMGHSSETVKVSIS